MDNGRSGSLHSPAAPQTVYLAFPVGEPGRLYIPAQPGQSGRVYSTYQRPGAMRLRVVTFAPLVLYFGTDIPVVSKNRYGVLPIQ